MYDIKEIDCLKLLKSLPDASVDLILTDPPYDLDLSIGNSFLSERLKSSNDELIDLDIENCKGVEWCKEIKRIQGGKINTYIFCNKKQIPMYFDYFIKNLKCSFDILIWHKTNTPPTIYNKYLSDKEYCLHFRKGAWCMPKSVKDGSTIYTSAMNVKDKKLFDHPTPKPVEFLRRIIRNSTKENQTVLDPFMGAGSTGVAAIAEGRKFIGGDIIHRFVVMTEARLINEKINTRK